MKIRPIAILALSLTLFACHQKEELPKENPQGKPETPDQGEPVLNCSETSFIFGPDGGSSSAEITCNRRLKAVSAEQWCKIVLTSQEETNKFRLFISAEEYRQGRCTFIKLIAPECDTVRISVEQKRQLSSQCWMANLKLLKSQNSLNKDIEFHFNANDSTFTAKYLKWIEDSEPEMLIPTFIWTGEKVTVNGETIEPGVSRISFANDFTFTVHAESGKTRHYKVSLNCPQINRELAVLHMKPAQEITKSFYVNTEIELYDKTEGSSGEGWWKSSEKGNIEVRGRGNSTWGLPKKPFRLKFSEKFSPIGLNHAKDKSWVIMGQDMDKSLIRNKIAFEYSRILFDKTENYHDEDAVLFTPSLKFINVYFTGRYYDSSTGITKNMDGDYLGVYQLSDQIERGKGRIEVDKLVALDGDDPTKISGGYIIETDIHEGNHYSGYKGIKMTYKYPDEDDHANAQYNYIDNHIYIAEKVLYSSSYTDPQKGWRKYFDEKTLADFIIIKELVGDLDGYTSTYFYKRRNNDKLFFGPIWDCDKGWDNDKRVPHYEYNPKTSLMLKAGFWMPNYVSNDWFNRFWSDATFRSFIRKRWFEKKDELVAATMTILDEIPKGMEKAIDANFTVWPFYYQYSSEANMPAKTYEDEIERIKQLTLERAELLDKLFN